MYDKALQVLNIFYNHGYLAYIVGGYPRDMLLGIKSNDIDICTNASPKEVMDIMDTENIIDPKYGSVTVLYKKCRFDVTTFRKDIKYENNRKPVKIKYVDTLKKDLLRRDFTINTICIDKDGNFVDLLLAKEDIDKKIIRTVGNPRYRIKEDSLRILRAIRFASILDFEIDKKTLCYLKKYGYLLKNLSYTRKKAELDKIFASKNKEKARKLILELGLDKYLELNNLKDIKLCDDIIGIWSQLEVSDNYHFSKLEREMIKNIRSMLKEEINEFSIYKYGLYVASVVGSIRGVSYKKINNIYLNLVIYSLKDININGLDIANCLGKRPGNYLKEIMRDIEKKILDREINNEKDDILRYVKDKYDD